ncbi:hypothetical protein B7463_g6467, partial [Scytalidium lignicola]
MELGDEISRSHSLIQETAMADTLSILNSPPKILEGPRLLHKLIYWENHLSACAIDFSSGSRRERYTYQQVQACVLLLASKIKAVLAASSHNKRDRIIPVLVPQSPGLYISQLAILESGAAFCPINLDAPKDRIKFVIGDVAADIIITTAAFKEVVSWDNGPAVIIVDEFPSIPLDVDLSAAQPVSSIDPNLAYIMYTSGSSGTPKGVAVSHLAVSQSLTAHQRHIPQFKRFLQFASPSFDVSVFEIFFPLIRGCTLVGCDRTQLLNNLPGMINTLDVDAAELTPTVVGSLLQKRSAAPGLKLLLTIGEMLTTPIVEEFGGSDLKESMLYGMYGPTEAAIHCTIFPRMQSNCKASNIGIPLDTTSIFIAKAADNNEKLEFLPAGEVGELVLGGPQLAEGYLNRPEQNKAAFVQFEGGKYYRTGDKATVLPNGTIEIHGRMSAGQVKLRGQRVELGEIEEAVYKHPGIKTATAIVLGSVLIVFVLVDDNRILPEDVLNTSAAWLPKFMVPSEIVILKSFPYLPSGKVDKRKLQSDYEKQREVDRTESAENETATEKAVRESLQEFLGAFPSHIRLAAAGLESLTAIRVASKLRSASFNVTTIAVLQAVTLTSRPTSFSASVSNGTENIDSIMPCTPLQLAMLSETATDAKAYQNWVEIDLPKVQESATARVILSKLVESNPILRTGFTESQDKDGYVQIVRKIFPVSNIKEVDQLDYNPEIHKENWLEHPIRVQILKLDDRVRLLLHIHHALYDAWSLELILDDLNSLLLEQKLPERPSFGRVVDSYLDGTLDIDSWALKDYWRDHLQQLDIRQVPNFNTRKSIKQGLKVAELQTSILTADIEVTARRLYSSPQSLLQAAYAVILSSYLGSQDVCFGTVFSGRTLPIEGIEGIAGPCLATLPVRVDLSASGTLQELLQELNSINRKHLEHSTLPLRAIKSAAGVDPRQVLFDTLFVWQQTLHDPTHLREHVSLVNSVDNLEFNLTVEVTPGPENIYLKASYQESLFPESQIKVFLSQIEQLTQAILKKETLTYQDAYLHLEDNLLSMENKNPDIVLGNQTLASPVEDVAKVDPDRPAIDFAIDVSSGKSEIRRMSYSELNNRANQIGHFLLDLKVVPDDLVCICMEKSLDLYTCILSTAKIGVGYLPLTPDVPQERFERILVEAKVGIVLMDSTSKTRLRVPESVKAVRVDEITLDSFSCNNISSKSSLDNIAYCVFTSGSTGNPKGVLVNQRNIVNNLDVLEKIYPASPLSRFLQQCSQGFDVSVFEIFFTWRIGACLCTAVKDVLFRDIESAIRELDITHLSMTPTVAALVNPENVPKVQFLVTAGEALTQKVFNAWAGKGLYQGYGPSETTNICTLNGKVSLDDFVNNIGRPFQNTSAFVISSGPDFVPLPRGAEGELCFGGSQVYQGYVDSSQNIGKIIDHHKYGRLYRSGDFGRMMPDGSLTFTGRKDDQVKIRGQRVELGEIDNVMLGSNEVEDCITMIIGADDSSQRLVCFWKPILEESERLQCLAPDTVKIGEFYRALESAVPAYMIPSSLIPISTIPFTSQGKIDKRLLEKQYVSLDQNYLDQVGHALITFSDHAWTSLEKVIASTLTKLVKVPLEEIGPGTSFFSFGIDSISAIPFSKLLTQATAHQVKISDVLKYPTIVRLAEQLSSSDGDTGDSGPVTRQESHFEFPEDFTKSVLSKFNNADSDVETILPCTPLQEAMLSAAESSSPGSYSNHVVFDPVGSIEKLEWCWKEMARRHEILRTSFIQTDLPRYAYVQVILAKYDLKIGSIDGQSKDINQILREIEVHFNNNVYTPPYRLNFLHTSEHTKLLVSMHHALYDGVALTTLYDEVERLYRGQVLPPPVSFVPFIEYITSTDTQKCDNFWDNTLHDCSETLIQTSFQSRKETSRNTLFSTKLISPLNWIEDQIKKYSTSLLAVCQTSWAAVLSEHLHQDDICFGNVVNGRSVGIEGIERLVAPCFNTIPVRLKDTSKLSYLESFRSLQSYNADYLPFQFTPLRRILARTIHDGPHLFDTLFLLQQPAIQLDPSIWSITHEEGIIAFPLVCEVVPDPHGNKVEILFHSYGGVINTEDISNLADEFMKHLQTALENPRRQILPQAIKDLILEKQILQYSVKSEGSHIVKSVATMTAEQLKLRDVISAFTDTPVDKIGPDVTIFRLGLDSISVVQAAYRLRDQGYNILASDILENPSISQLDLFLKKNQDISKAEPIEYDFKAFDKKFRDVICKNNNIDTERVQCVRPCTAVQEGMLAQTLHSDGEEYMNSIYMRLFSSISIPKLKAGWELVIKDHEMLRTGFTPTGDPDHPFAMVTYSEDKFLLPWFEGSYSLPTLFERLIQAPWALLITPMEDELVIKFEAHHAIYDAQSIQMILSDVADAYNSKNRPIPLPINTLLGPILISANEDPNAQTLFWQKDENKIIVNKFPNLRPLHSSSKGVLVREILSTASTSELDDICRQQGVTMQAAGQAAWARLLAAYTGESDTTFGVTLSGRSITEYSDRVCFPSIVTLPVREYAVSLEMQPTDTGKLMLRLTFREDIIPSEHSELLLEQYNLLLLDLLQNPQAQCSLAPKADDALISITPAKYSELNSPVKLLHEFVESGARQWPDRIALEFATSWTAENVNSQTWTYRELDSTGNKVANLLIDQGILPGDMVAICFDKCPEASFAIIGILKAGCSYVALDPTAPAERLNFITEDSGAKLILTAGIAAKNVKSYFQESINLSIPKILECHSSDPPRPSREIRDSDTSYCLYTSGTTGTPKGCLLSHENAVQAMLAFQTLFAGHWDKDSKWLQFASFHFDVSVLEQFWSWSVGIRVVSAPRDLIFEDIAASISALGVTHIDLTPSLARLLHPDDVPSLHKGVFITGGEQLKQEILDVWGKYACIYNGYGPTEATIGVTMYPRVPNNGKPSNIGPQFLNVGSFVLKPGTELPVLRGGVGELCVSGKLVGIGYLNRPKLSADRFPVLGSFKERVYRTGDLVRILHDSSFIFLGRADDQVKLRGQRLELSEINEVIKRSRQDIEEVVTLVLKHTTQQKEQLVSFFVSSITADQQELPHIISSMRDACKSRLPGYMVPTHFIPIKKLPLNPNNKADTKQLAAMFNNLQIDDLQKLSRPSQSDGQWPQNYKELLDTIAALLKVEVAQLHKDSNIFELGLDSISVIGFAASLQRKGVRNAKPSVIMQNPALGQLIGLLSKDKLTDHANEDSYIASTQVIKSFSYKHLPSISKELGMEVEDIETITPCTPMQEGMIYRFLESEYPLYFNKFSFQLDTAVDTDKLLEAWRKVVAQLPILRTKFIVTDDGYAQVVIRTMRIVWEDLYFDHDASNKNLSLKFPFSTSLKFSSSERFMNLQIFHGLYDANSLTMILKHVIEEYRGVSNVDYGPSFTKSLAYGPLALRPEAKDFWTKHLKSWVDDSLPVRYKNAADVIVTRELQNITGLEDRRTTFGVTYQAIVMAAWVSVLEEMKPSNLTLGLIVSGRTIDFEGADKVAGPLFNTIPFHISVETRTTWQSLVQKCHDFNIQSQPYQHTPLKDIQKWGPAKKTRKPLFDNLFVFQRSFSDEDSFANDIWVPLDDSATADYPLAFEAALSHDLKTLRLSVVAQGSVITHDESSHLLEQMELVLQKIIEDPMSYTPQTRNISNQENDRSPSLTTHKLTNGETKNDILCSDDRRSFQLLENIQQLRQDIAILAKVSEDDIHEDSSIFELGLDSIDVIKLSGRVRKRGIQLPVSQIIQCQTIINMARRMVRDDHLSQVPSNNAITEITTQLTSYLRDQGQLPTQFQAVLPATPLQQSMIKEMLQSKYERYFNMEALRVSDSVNIARLESAMEQVIAASPILRTSFVEVNDPQIPYAFAQVYYISHKGSNYIVIAVAHALYDGRSLRLLHEDIYRAYNGTLHPRPEPINFLGTILNSTTEEAKKFWKTTLLSLPPARLPRKQDIQDMHRVFRSERASRVPLQAIESLSKSLGISMQTISQTCFVFVLSYLMKQLDVVFGSVLSCRDSEEANEVMFPLMNTVAVRAVLHGTVTDMLRFMQGQGDSARQYQHFPLGMAQSFGLAGRNAQAAKGQVLFDTLFIYQGRQYLAEQEPLYQSKYGSSDVEFPLCVEMEISTTKTPLWTIACKSSIQSADESDRLIDMLDSVLEKITSDTQAQTFVHEDDGISVCGLPKFKINSEPESTVEPPTQSNKVEWSDEELIIRKALHELSGFSEDIIEKDTTIFQLGLDSILVLKLAALLKSRGIKLKVSEILRDLTIFSMSQTLHQITPNGEEPIDIDSTLAAAIASVGAPAASIKVDDGIGKIRYIMPVTPGQQYTIRRWQASGRVMFYPTFSYRVSTGLIDKQKLESCWNSLRANHDILRTGFIEIGTTLVQVVFDDPPNPINLGSSNKSLHNNKDLRWPPLQLSVGEEGGYSVLKLTIHHALYDGVSMPNIIYQLQSLYLGNKLVLSSPSLRNFIAHSWVAAQQTAATTSYTNGSAEITATQQSWRDYLNGAVKYQAISPSQSHKRTEVFRPSLQIPPLKDLAQRADVSVDALILAAIAILYAKKLNNDLLDRDSSQIILGIYFANRAPFGEDLSELMAPTFNLLPLLVKDPLNRNIAEVAKDIQDDIRKISSAVMACASLDQIYRWTGVRVNFFVNILKDTSLNPEAVDRQGTENGDVPDEALFEAVQDFKEMSETIEDHPDTDMVSPANGSCDAYLPSLDVEIKYSENTADLGFFGPDDMISIPDAEEMIQRFVNIWI